MDAGGVPQNTTKIEHTKPSSKTLHIYSKQPATASTSIYYDKGLPERIIKSGEEPSAISTVEKPVSYTHLTLPTICSV